MKTKKKVFVAKRVGFQSEIKWWPKKKSEKGFCLPIIRSQKEKKTNGVTSKWQGIRKSWQKHFGVCLTFWSKNILESVLNNNLAYVNVESHESMCVMIMKCNTASRNSLWYTKYVTCSIVLIQQIKRYLRTTAIVLTIRERILQKICFEIRKDKSNFYVSTMWRPFERGPAANISNTFLLNTAFPGFSGYFLQLNNVY